MGDTAEDAGAAPTGARLAASTPAPGARRGRGATANPTGRYEPARRVAFDDGWSADDPAPLRTEVRPERSARIIARNTSPDIPFDRSLNPYRGCEHGCIYCYARPTHAWLGLSPGLDFESRLFTKPDAARLLARELAAPGYRPAPIAIGTATDPYQPIERTHRLTRAVLEVLAEARHPVSITTKSDLILRDLDLLREMAARDLVLVSVSLPTLDPALARRLDPRAPRPDRRLAAMRALAEAGVPVMVNLSPIIPGLTDHEIEGLLARARAHGASRIGHALLRLPGEVADLVADWFDAHYPEKKARAFALLAGARGGRENDSRFGHRFRGEGAYAALLGERVRLAGRRLGFGFGRLALNTADFRRPGGQLALF
ncbi:PA0069 family radical SAM protein [Methylobacterium sp. NEAU 140]|uniref:PA0069 family radical SAM protein n=1 Tax=Methylobacterium sp. NEAU 140 TaxID=3064945 RepID=UPI0027353ADE|nr:PA0069 family radical SAM protein [Methylobacterium sp. NEAU 140]MDP4021464.1 PA0069 family radical SAM protein [Methylobacterium sp. NEAU 140]